MLNCGWTISVKCGSWWMPSNVENRSSKWSSISCRKSKSVKSNCFSFNLALTGFLAATSVITSGTELEETLSNIPQTLSGECTTKDSSSCKKPKIQRPKSRKAESCTVKCLTTCIRGDEGEGPLNLTRPLVVFKQGFRTRQYCLVECSDICNLISDVEDGT
ncbi:PREDICTED: uncharacterized protein LOC109350771 [Lupinus angustifolius]|uniref:uncharacterized protein LOC109350771 n=1 Tax=Lupinus angustifolius TaxID=3871 RepID=UPI00092ED9B0|nr:PREDICTED: uncharacterized protein LOC109350771 [Lupinus angustifolius]